MQSQDRGVVNPGDPLRATNGASFQEKLEDLGSAVYWRVHPVQWIGAFFGEGFLAGFAAESLKPVSVLPELLTLGVAIVTCHRESCLSLAIGSQWSLSGPSEQSLGFSPAGSFRYQRGLLFFTPNALLPFLQVSLEIGLLRLVAPFRNPEDLLAVLPLGLHFPALNKPPESGVYGRRWIRVFLQVKTAAVDERIPDFNRRQTIRIAKEDFRYCLRQPRLLQALDKALKGTSVLNALNIVIQQISQRTDTQNQPVDPVVNIGPFVGQFRKFTFVLNQRHH
ncbi:MAG: hypothetical protein HYX73_05470 [Acidobacteria bacterium]|nr:hypothetical protein [Acidobacteriota bacterium]